VVVCSLGLGEEEGEIEEGRVSSVIIY